MSELLTHEEYESVAKSLNLPTSAFINGKCVQGTLGEFDSVNVENGIVSLDGGAISVTVTDPAILDEIKNVFVEHGIGLIAEKVAE